MVNDDASRGRLRQYLSPMRIVGAVVVLLASVMTVFLIESRTGEIPYRGRIIRIPLRSGSFRLMVSEGRARYIEPGPADIKPLLDERGPELGWRFLHQAGGIYSIVSTEDDNLRVVMVTEPVMSRFVHVDCYVEEDPPSVEAPRPSR